MPTDFDSKVWLDDLTQAAGLTPEERTQVEFVFGKKGASDFLKGSVLRQSDYSKKMDVLRAQEQDAQKLATANSALQQELVRWKTSEVDPTLAKANKIVADQAGIKARIEERARQLKEKYGMEDEDVTALLETTAAIQAAAPVAAAAAGATITDDGKFVKSEDFNKVALSMPRVAARLVKLERQFDRLFAGTAKEFDPDAVLELAEKEGLNLDTAFSKLYDVPTRQSELTEATVQKRIAEEVAKKTAVLEAKYAASPAYVRSDEEASPISKVLERHSKGNRDADGKFKPAEPANPIDQVRQASRGLAPDADVQRYVNLSRSGKWREAAAKEGART